MIFIGDDWADDHHDICIEDEVGKILCKKRLSETIEGVAEFHELVARYASDPKEVFIGVETDRGLFIGALIASGYVIYPMNPLSVSRYRDRHGTSHAKSDPADAKLLAEIIRTDRHNHRPIANNSNGAEGLKILERQHQNLIWSRQASTNALHSALREFYPAALDAFGDELASSDAISVLKLAPTPSAGKKLTVMQIEKALRSGGRQRNVTKVATEIKSLLGKEHLAAPKELEEAFGISSRSMVAIIESLNVQIKTLEKEINSHFDAHPDSKIISSLPGLGAVLGARVLGELGDDPDYYHDAKSRKNAAGTSPITVASGKKRVVTARFIKNDRLVNACDQWAFSSLQRSPGARALYDRRRNIGDSHHQALRKVANRWVGILHGCLKTRSLYDEDIAWPKPKQEGEKLIETVAA